MKKGKPCWMDPLEDLDANNEAITTYCLPIYSAEGKRIGIMGVDVTINMLSRIILAAKPSENSYSVMLGSDGSFIIHPDSTKRLNETVYTELKHGSDPSVKEAVDAMMSGQKGYKRIRKDGKDCYVFYQPFTRNVDTDRYLADMGWSVGIVYPEEDIFGDYNRLLTYVLLIAFIGILLLVLLCRFIIHRRLLPLIFLTKSAHRIANGHYDEAIPDSHQDDEIGQLQNHFQHMQVAMAKHVDELEHLNIELQERGERLRVAYHQAQAADRLKTSFLHNMTNQMLSPVQMISERVTDLYQMQTMKSQDLDRMADDIQKQGEVITELLNHLLELASKLGVSILLLSILVFVASLGVMFVQSRLMLRKKATERIVCVLDNTVQRVRTCMNRVETATNSNGWMALEYLNPDSLLTISRHVVSVNPHVNGCSITTEPDVFPELGPFSVYSIKEGDSVLTVREAAYDYYNQVWYKLPKTQARPCWTDPFNDYNDNSLYTKNIIASYCKPLYSDDGRFLGVISTDLSFKHLKETIVEKQPYPNTYFALVNSEGRYIIHPDSTKEFNKTIFEDLNAETQPDLVALGHEMTTGGKGNMRVTVNGTSCLVCYQPIPDTKWCLALVIPDREILQTYYRLAYVIVSLIVIGLIIILLITWKIVDQSIKPLSQLLAQLQIIAQGYYDEHISHTERRDAVGRLQNSFATMQESLNRHVTDISHAAEEARLRNEELVKATKMAEEADRQKTIFIQNVTHQIRTPLNIIMGFAQVLRNSNGEIPHDEVKKIVDMMDHNAKTLSRMLLMLYDSSDAGASVELQIHTDEMVSCNEVANESINFTREHFPEINVRLESDLPDAYRLRTNRLYLMRTLRELLYNAAKYSNGAIVLFRIQDTGNTIRFIVEDQGPGMSEAYQEKMYEPFTKVNELSEGLGLGLPLSKRHSRSLGGDLFLDTSYHDGCRFILELPK